MYEDYDDFECEPTAAELVVAEATQKMIALVKAEVVAHFRQVTERNEHLEDLLDKHRDRELKLREGEREVARLRRELEAKVKSVPLGEIMGNVSVIMYSANRTYVNLPKCEKCNDEQYILYTTPLGKAAKERCDCFKSLVQYVPEKQVLYEFTRRQKRILMWFRPHQAQDYFSGGKLAEAVYDGGEFPADYQKGLLFSEREDCERYCEFLNQQVNKET